ncbi:MAG: phosphate/phosphite/phosphonate ABC transporter substrate-binding protein, partial [Clostridium sp.]
MKKIIALAASMVIAMGAFVGCGSKEAKLPDELVVYFVPSRESEEIVTATEPLKAMLKDALKEEGYEFKDIKIQVGTSFEAVGEALASGTADVGFIPGGTYVLYDDGAEVALTATRDGLSHDSENPADWNKSPTAPTKDQVTYYRALAVAGPSAKGKELAAKINAGEKLTAEDIKSAKFGVSSSSSPAGYIYPTLWLQENFGLSITDLPNAVQNPSYGSALASLAAEQLDVIFMYADARRDFEKQWTTDNKRTASIWEETQVIGVTDGIYNDTISVSKNVDFIDADFKKALQNAFIKIGNTEEGKKVISIYSHNGYEIGEDAN